jgi:hypothetical protein
MRFRPGIPGISGLSTFRELRNQNISSFSVNPGISGNEIQTRYPGIPGIQEYQVSRNTRYPGIPGLFIFRESRYFWVKYFGSKRLLTQKYLDSRKMKRCFEFLNLLSSIIA